MIYDVKGNELHSQYILVGAILDANSDAARFTAMKELLDIGKKKINNPDVNIADTEFTAATKGAVCILPSGHSAMYEKYPFSYLYAKDETVQAVPASTTKVMTLVTGLDFLSNLKEIITIKSADIESGSGNYFSAGDTMTVEDLMRGMMLPSSNTCAKAFARICGDKILNNEAPGTYTDAQCYNRFITEMNTKAAYIGMANSLFNTASGASTTTKSTCADMIQLMVEASSYPQICKIWNKKTYTIAVGGSNPRNVDLVSSLDDATLENSYYLLGGKTGSLTPGAKALMVIAIPK